MIQCPNCDSSVMTRRQHAGKQSLRCQDCNYHFRFWHTSATKLDYAFPKEGPWGGGIFDRRRDAIRRVKEALGISGDNEGTARPYAPIEHKLAEPDAPGVRVWRF